MGAGVEGPAAAEAQQEDRYEDPSLRLLGFLPRREPPPEILLAEELFAPLRVPRPAEHKAARRVPPGLQAQRVRLATTLEMKLMKMMKKKNKKMHQFSDGNSVFVFAVGYWPTTGRTQMKGS